MELVPSLLLNEELPDFQSGYRQIALRIEFDTLLRNLSALLGQDVRHLSFDETQTNQLAMEALPILEALSIVPDVSCPSSRSHASHGS